MCTSCLRKGFSFLSSSDRSSPSSHSFIPVWSTQACKVAKAAALTFACRETKTHTITPVQNPSVLLKVLHAYLAVSQYCNDRDTQRFNMLLQSRSHGCSELLQDGQGLLDLINRQRYNDFLSHCSQKDT